MSAPEMVFCIKNQWKKVMTDVTSGIIHIKRSGVNQYLHTYRSTGDPAPLDRSDAIPIYGYAAEVITEDPIDVYIMAVDKDGEVRIDNI